MGIIMRPNMRLNMRLLIRNNECGVTLIEVMLAGILLTIGLLASLSGQVQAISMNRESRTSLRATAAAEDMIESIRRNRGNVLLYNGMGTDIPVTELAPLVAANPGVTADFNQFVSLARAITSSKSGGVYSGNGEQGTGRCIPPVIGEAPGIIPDLIIPCGSVSVLPGAIAGVPNAFTVSVRIAWPGQAGRPNGMIMTTTVRQ